MIRPFFTTRFWGKDPYGSSYNNKRSDGNSNGNEVTLQTIGAKPSRAPVWKHGEAYDITTIATVNQSKERIVDTNDGGGPSTLARDLDASSISIKRTIKQTSSKRDGDSERRPGWIGSHRWSPV